jgi:hypothetical protein
MPLLKKGQKMSNIGFADEATPGEGVREFYRRQGEKRFADIMTIQLVAQQCFDQINNAACEHQACYMLADILSQIEKEKNKHYRKGKNK